MGQPSALNLVGPKLSKEGIGLGVCVAGMLVKVMIGESRGGDCDNVSFETTSASSIRVDDEIGKDREVLSPPRASFPVQALLDVLVLEDEAFLPAIHHGHQPYGQG